MRTGVSHLSKVPDFRFIDIAHIKQHWRFVRVKRSQALMELCWRQMDASTACAGAPLRTGPKRDQLITLHPNVQPSIACSWLMGSETVVISIRVQSKRHLADQNAQHHLQQPTIAARACFTAPEESAPVSHADCQKPHQSGRRRYEDLQNQTI
jgi:hypothetical protein